MKIISKEELEQNNSEKNLWLLINNKIYDLTKYQYKHPGSDVILQDVAGKDATQDFNDVGHSNNAIELMEKFEIGEIDENTKMLLKEKQKNINKNTNIFTIKSIFILFVIGFICNIFFFYILK